MISKGRLIDAVIGPLLVLLLVGGCSARLQKAALDNSDVVLTPSRIEESPERLRCGYYAARHLIRHYEPGIADADIRTDSLLFSKANDTVSIFHFLRDNVDIPLIIKSGRVDELLGSVSAGDPIFVFMPVGAFDTRWFAMSGTALFHAIVVVGYSADETKLFFYSDGDGPYMVGRDRFVAQWARVDNLLIMGAP